MFGLLFKENYASRLSYLQQRLREQNQSLNYLIRVRADAVHGLQTQAQDYLEMTSKDPPFIPNALRENADKTFYHLDETSQKDLIGNLVGKGDLASLTEQQKHEIQMAFNLNPQFRAIKKNIKSVTSLYYVSESGFENYFPWKPSHRFKWEQNQMKSRFLADLSIFNLPYGDLSWSDVYQRKEKAQLTVTCAAPIYWNENFLGVVAIDFTLDAMADFIASISNPYGRLLIVNNYQTVIADTNSPRSDNAIIINTQQALSSDLSLDKINELPRKELTRLGSYWVFQVKSRFAPWTLIYYVSDSEVLMATLEETGPSVLFLIIFAIIILRGANSLIAQEFIRPTQKLIYFITSQAKESKEAYKNIREPWIRWFEAVDIVFKENRSLVLRLEQNIHELDSIVHERTSELSTKNLKLTRALNDLKKMQNQLIVQEKLAGLGALTAGIAHEIKNPLNYVINFSELSREYITEILPLIQKNMKKETEKVQEILYSLTHNLQRIEDHGKRADAIIRSMLLHARAGEEFPEETNINDLIDENIHLAVSGLGQQSFLPKIIKNFDSNLVPLKVYRRELGRVILNIINNACYALYQKKTASNHPYEAEIIVETLMEKKNIRIRIRDNGPGMTEKVRKNIFIPFFTTKPAGSGTGLGLSLSYEIITKQHHGTLMVDSMVGEFTEFIILLPHES